MVVTILVLAAAAVYFMTSEERAHVQRVLLGQFHRAKRAVVDARTRQATPGTSSEGAAWPVVSIAFVAINVTVFGLMLSSGTGVGNEQTLLSWGGNFGPRTTNGEWWRLVTAMFVHGGVLSLAINSVCLLQVGALLERLVGRAAFSAVYVATGVLASAVNLAMDPVTVSAGASGAVLGLYGFLIASFIWSHFPGSRVTIPFAAFKTIAPVSALFVLYTTATAGLGDAIVLAGFGGMGCGVLLCRRISEGQPRGFPIAVVAGITMMFALDGVLPLRGMANVKPEMERIVALETHLAKEYNAAVERFTTGRMTAKALSDVIQRQILPELAVARARVDSLQKIPASQESLMASARVYLRLRDESWRLRAEALRKTSMTMLRQADGVEHASLIALQQISIASAGMNQ